MLYNSSNSKVKTGDVDPFNKKKLAEEARRDQEKIKKDQTETERRKLQLEIDNLERELIRFTGGLQTKKNLLLSARRKVEEAKTAIFLLEKQIKENEGSLGYLKVEVATHDTRTNAIESDLEKTRSQITTVEKDRAMFEAEYNKDKLALDDLTKKMDKLKEELARMLIETKVLEKEVDEDQEAVKRKESEENRLTLASKNIEMSTKQVSGAGLRISKDTESKEREIKKAEQDLFLKKRAADQLASQAEDMARDLTKSEQEEKEKKKRIDDLKRKKEAIR
jgi:chromosome segregation ATPase